MPEEWARVGYPSLKPLGAWIKDYTARIAFMRTWLQRGHPACFWLPGFFFPQGFLTGMLQMHARKYAVPIDSLSYSFKVGGVPCVLCGGGAGRRGKREEGLACLLALLAKFL